MVTIFERSCYFTHTQKKNWRTDKQGHKDSQTDLGKPYAEKNLLLFGIFPNGLDPPPVFLERFEELF